MGMVGLNVKLLGKLCVDGFNLLSNSIEELLDLLWKLLLLVGTGQGFQP